MAASASASARAAAPADDLGADVEVRSFAPADSSSLFAHCRSLDKGRIKVTPSPADTRDDLYIAFPFDVPPGDPFSAGVKIRSFDEPPSRFLEFKLRTARPAEPARWWTQPERWVKLDLVVSSDAELLGAGDDEEKALRWSRTKLAALRDALAGSVERTEGQPPRFVSDARRAKVLAIYGGASAAECWALFERLLRHLDDGALAKAKAVRVRKRRHSAFVSKVQGARVKMTEMLVEVAGREWLTASVERQGYASVEGAEAFFGGLEHAANARGERAVMGFPEFASRCAKLAEGDPRAFAKL
jgi:hypothetical protein